MYDRTGRANVAATPHPSVGHRSPGDLAMRGFGPEPGALALCFADSDKAPQSLSSVGVEDVRLGRKLSLGDEPVGLAFPPLLGLASSKRALHNTRNGSHRKKL